jgi:hypothetical protein
LLVVYEISKHLKKIRETDAGPFDFQWFHKFF